MAKELETDDGNFYSLKTYIEENNHKYLNICK